MLAAGSLLAIALTLPRRADARLARQALQADGARPSTGGDTAAIHRDLRKSIQRFQDAWRKNWQKVEVKRHGNLKLSNIRGYLVRNDGVVEGPFWQGDRDALNLTPELRRYLAIICNIDSPTDRQIEYSKSRKGTAIGTPIATAVPLELRPSGGTDPVRTNVLQRSVTFATPRLIAASPNYGGICPSWTPPDEPLPLDEGESIDLALPPANRDAVRREREGLISTLAAARAKFPRDEWIAGQHLRFVLDQRSPARGLEAAGQCAGSPSWCARLTGLAQEHAGRTDMAEGAYRFADSLAALETGTATAACVRADIWLLLQPGDRDEAQRASCEHQRNFVNRMWWLADPLWSVPGNERYVAHESRRLHVTLRSVLDRDERYVWARLGGGEAMRELVMRYGWPGYTYWPGGPLEEEVNKVREDPSRPRLVMPPYTAKEYSSDRTALLPSIDGINNPFEVTSSHWTLRLPAGKDPDEWWPREHMMLWTHLRELSPGQQGQWRRDSTVLFAMAVDRAISGLDTAATGPSKAFLVGSTGPRDARILSATPISFGQTLRLHGEFPSQPLVLSAEVQARTQREAARRLRFGLQPSPSLRDMKADETAISTPVFMHMGSRDVVLPNNLDAARLFMAGTSAFSHSDMLALFWESYGFPPGDTVDFELRVNRRDELNLARRVGAALGVASPLRDSISIKWSEPDARNGASVVEAVKPIIGRAIALDVRSLPAGSYAVTIEMRTKTGLSARNEQPFTILESRVQR